MNNVIVYVGTSVIKSLEIPYQLIKELLQGNQYAIKSLKAKITEITDTYSWNRIVITGNRFEFELSSTSNDVSLVG